MKSAGVAAIILIAVAASECAAADLRLPYKAAPADPAFSWAGCHVGGNIGWIGGAGRFDLYPDGSHLTQVSAADRAANSHSYAPGGSAFTFGGAIGCDRQWGAAVFGVEADINWSGLKETAQASYPIITAPSGLQWAAHTETVSKKLDWFSTIRARAGFAVDRALIFATGGLAIADVRSDLDYLNDFGSHRVGSARETRIGWAGGGGVEYGLTRNWSMKLEYLYLDFGKFSYSSPNIGAPSANSPGDSWGTDVRVREHILRVGVNYRFGDPTIIARY